jgi:hypothetical protein
MSGGSNYLDPDPPETVRLSVGDARALGEARLPASDTAQTTPASSLTS